MAPEFPGEGRVVEVWPVNNKKEIDFVARHGSAFGDVSDKVHELADEAARLLKENKVYTPEEQQDLFRQNDLRAWAAKLEKREQKLRDKKQQFTKQKNDFTKWRDKRMQELRSLHDRQRELDDLDQEIANRELLVSNRELQANKRDGCLDAVEETLKRQRSEFQQLQDAWHQERHDIWIDQEKREKELLEGAIILQQDRQDWEQARTEQRYKLDKIRKQQDSTRGLLRLQAENLLRREERVDDFMRYLKRHPIRAGLRMIFRRKL